MSNKEVFALAKSLISNAVKPVSDEGQVPAIEKASHQIEQEHVLISPQVLNLLIELLNGHNQTAYPPLELVTQPNVGTAAAAHYSNRKQQTLREWASKGTGPIKPKRINGRLEWSVLELKRLAGK